MKTDLDVYGAQRRLLLFLKLRKGKTITQKEIDKFYKLLDDLWGNFKDSDETRVSKYTQNRWEMKEAAMHLLRTQFMQWKKGGYNRLSDIESFSYYQDEKHRAKIKGEKDLKEITEWDYTVLRLAIYGIA